SIVFSGRLLRVSWARDLAHDCFPSGVSHLHRSVFRVLAKLDRMLSPTEFRSSRRRVVLAVGYTQGLVFDLPGFSLEVAPECSGIHSTLVLFITSLLAG